MREIICKDTGEIVHDYKSYLNTRHWQIKRLQIAKYRKYTCEICGKNCRETNNRANIHHKTYVRIGNELNKDLYYLCEHCHNEVHKYKITFNLDKYKQQPTKSNHKKYKNTRKNKVKRSG